MGGLLSGILGGGSSPGQEAQMAGLKQSREGIQRYRPEAMQAHLNLLSNASKAYQPMNNALETMYGGRGPKPPTIGDAGPPEGAPYAPPGQPAAPPGQPEQPQGRPQQPPTAFDGVSFLLDPLGLFR
jgi:hypothetical protein